MARRLAPIKPEQILGYVCRDMSSSERSKLNETLALVKFKHCDRCSAVKSHDRFSKDNTQSDHLYLYCKDCRADVNAGSDYAIKVPIPSNISDEFITIEGVDIYRVNRETVNHETVKSGSDKKPSKKRNKKSTKAKTGSLVGRTLKVKVIE